MQYQLCCTINLTTPLCLSPSFHYHFFIFRIQLRPWMTYWNAFPGMQSSCSPWQASPSPGPGGSFPGTGSWQQEIQPNLVALESKLLKQKRQSQSVITILVGLTGWRRRGWQTLISVDLIQTGALRKGFHQVNINIG